MPRHPLLVWEIQILDVANEEMSHKRHLSTIESRRGCYSDLGREGAGGDQAYHGILGVRR